MTWLTFILSKNLNPNIPSTSFIFTTSNLPQSLQLAFPSLSVWRLVVHPHNKVTWTSQFFLILLGGGTHCFSLFFTYTHKSVLSHVINGNAHHSKKGIESQFSLILSLSSGSFLHYLFSFARSLMWHLSGHVACGSYLQSVCVPSCQNTFALTYLLTLASAHLLQHSGSVWGT